MDLVMQAAEQTDDPAEQSLDNDGRRDLFVGVGLGAQALGDGTNLDRLLRAAGDGTFQDVSATSGVARVMGLLLKRAASS